MLTTHTTHPTHTGDADIGHDDGHQTPKPDRRGVGKMQQALFASMWSVLRSSSLIIMMRSLKLTPGMVPTQHSTRPLTNRSWASLRLYYHESQRGRPGLTLLCG